MDSVYALTIILYFAWSLASICSTLLVVQMELVAFYFCYHQKTLILTEFHSFSISGAKWESNWVDKTNIHCILVFCSTLSDLWIWKNVNRSLRTTERRHQWLRLDFITDKNTKDFADYHSEYATTSRSWDVQKYFMQSWIVYKGKSFPYKSSILICQFVSWYVLFVHQVTNGGFSYFMIFREFRWIAHRWQFIKWISAPRTIYGDF